MLPRGWFFPPLACALGLTLVGCNESALQAPSPDAGTAVAGLSSEQAARVVAKVGDKTITLGDFARTLDRMDQFDRLRYQTKERRRELLDEIVDVELLAAEARRRGLDKSPEVEDAVRQVLRDAILSEARQGLPAPAEIPAEEVRAYYEANIDRFREPERRRVGAIALADKKEAEKVLKAALKATTPAGWGELVQKSGGPAKPQGAPVDLAGDLGFVGPPDDPKGASGKVPEPVRAAVFQIASAGEVLDHLVEADGKYYVVRMNGLTAGHSRTLAEADRSIRVALLQQKMQDLDKALEADLRAKFPVAIDEQALAKVKLPSAIEKMDLSSGASAYPVPGAEPAPGDKGPDAGVKPAGDTPAAPEERDGGR